MAWYNFPYLYQSIHAGKDTIVAIVLGYLHVGGLNYLTASAFDGSRYALWHYNLAQVFQVV